MKFACYSLLLAGLMVGCRQDPSTGVHSLAYPVTRTVDTTTNYFGTEVADPYRWLEDDLSDETAQWVKAQNDVTFGYLEKIPFRKQINERLQKLFDYARISAPEKNGDWEYFTKNDGLQNQSVWYRRKSQDEEPEIFLDPNSFSDDGTISLAGTSFTDDGSLFGFMISIGGSDWRKAMVMDTRSGEIIEDTLQNIKFSGLSWRGNEGFYYSSYDKPTDGSELSAKTQVHQLFYHKLGTPQSQDELVFGGESQPFRYIFGYVTEDDRYLVISAANSTSGNVLYIKDLTEAAGKIVLIDDDMETEEGILFTEGDRLILQTNEGSPNQRIVETTIQNPTSDTWND
ncbi:MAG: S9 family peptidase, partial [Cyclobacteriaceae bacterium]|nr:S9 family peptidase [Cyclobacteriaceae bacterium]